MKSMDEENLVKILDATYRVTNSKSYQELATWHNPVDILPALKVEDS